MNPESGRRMTFWDFATEKFLALGFDPEYVRQEIEEYKALSVNTTIYPEGDATVKRDVLSIIERLEGGQREE